MIFRFYNSAMSQASKSAATAILTIGLLLIGFGVLIMAFPEVFALLAAIVFFLLGLSLAITAAKMFWVQYKMDKYHRQHDEHYRENVRIRDHDF